MIYCSFVSISNHQYREMYLPYDKIIFMKTPYFLWDYDLAKHQIRSILHGNNEVEKLWLMARIMTHAKFEDVWQYLRVEDIAKAFTKLRLPPKVKQSWRHALNVWGYHV